MFLPLALRDTYPRVIGILYFQFKRKMKFNIEESDRKNMPLYEVTILKNKLYQNGYS